MINTIIFDIGNVLVDYCWKDHIDHYQFSEEISKRVADAVMLSDTWNHFDQGVFSDEHIIQLFVENDPEIEREIREVCKDFYHIIRRRDYIIPWLTELKQKGYRVLYLSNFAEKTRRECQHALDFMPHMDGGIMSYEVKQIKPFAEIYQTLLKKYQLSPEKCVFLDDLEANCQAARDTGMHAIVFTTKEAAEEELKKLGVK